MGEENRTRTLGLQMMFRLFLLCFLAVCVVSTPTRMMVWSNSQIAQHAHSYDTVYAADIQSVISASVGLESANFEKFFTSESAPEFVVVFVSDASPTTFTSIEPSEQTSKDLCSF